MKLISLVENSSSRADCAAVHGLSLYLETPKHRLLFDVGPNALFLENAKTLGVDIQAVDLLVLSHGHLDHGGGLELFCKRNKQAPILVGEGAFGDHAVAEDGAYRSIGLPTLPLKKYPERFSTVSGQIDEELYLFSEIQGEKFLTEASSQLLAKVEAYRPAAFGHEQNLLITWEGKSLLLAGCAHRGIVNILETAEAQLGKELDYVVSGFHLTNPSLGKDEPEALIRAVGENLAGRKATHYITGHCTGLKPYVILKEILKDRLETMPVGSVFTLG